jgi:hypothetical protein
MAIINHLSPSQALARKLAHRFGALPNVQAVALAGSQTAGTVDPISDIDLYVYTTAEIPLSERVALVNAAGATRADLNLQFWDLGDEWYDAETGIEVDVIYWDVRWIEGQIDRVLVQHQASLGYSTCFWHTLRNSLLLYDKDGWLHALQKKCAQEFPEELRRAIIAKNHPVLRRVIPSYGHQIEKAVRRNDLMSINHRVAALLASYFDVLFALNRILNPGEKRVLKFASEHCARVPEGMLPDVAAVLQATCSADEGLVTKVETLLDGLDQLLLQEGFDPQTSLPLV